MIRRVLQTIRTRGLLERGQHVLVGVSGGADSVALAYILHYLRKRYGLRLTLAHLHHGLRGAAADRDEGFVRRLGWRLGLPVICGRADVRRRARAAGISLEMAAREARRDFFRRVAAEVQADALALAHTQDDHAETVLLRLARGAGTQGLGGIPHAGLLHGLRVVRPLRDVTHQDAVRFLRAHGLAWREDASNRDLQFLRNRVRQEILPLLERRLNPRVREALARAADLLREDHEWLDQLTKEVLDRCRVGAGAADLSRRALLEGPRAARRRVLLRWLMERGLEPEALNYDALARLEGLLGSVRGLRSVPLPGGWRAVARYDTLSLEKGGASVSAVYREPVAVPGETLLPEQNLRVVTAWGRGWVRGPSSGVGGLPAGASLGAAALGRARLFVRSWRPGDRFRPLGFRGSKKVQDIFVDHKVARDRRAGVPLLECRGQIVWIPGYRVGRGWEVERPGSRSLHVWIERMDK